MSEFNLEATLEQLANTAKEYESVINPGFSMLENCNYIVQVGPYTVGKQDDGKTCLIIAKYPTQFTKSTAESIAQLTFTDGAGKPVTPKIMLKREWYQTRLDEIRETLEMFGRSNA